MTTALIYHPDCLQHDTGPGHPERPDRLTAIIERFDRWGLLSQVEQLTPEEATDETLERNHTSEHLERVARASTGGLQYLCEDTIASPGTEHAARLAAGGVTGAIDSVMRGSVRNAFCITRPPGHHAEKAVAMGFCFYNNVAIGARHLRTVHGLDRVAIIDWDVHHGNGTQHSFEDDPTVFFCSVHQFPHYPGTGASRESGRGEGLGTTLNVPVTRGYGDSQYLEIFEQQLVPALEEFDPQFLLISAGFDAHRADPLGDVDLTETGYRKLTKTVTGLAEGCCEGRLVSVLEGGYDLEATAAAAGEHLGALLQSP
jgi:acetoin utilization deacetylase AcuC-like enzyme